MNSTKGCLQLTAQKTGQRHFPELLMQWRNNGGNGKRKENDNG